MILFINNENNIKNFFKAKRKQIKNIVCQLLRFSQFIPLKPCPKAIFNCNTIYYTPIRKVNYL